MLTVFDAPMPTGEGFSACVSPYRRPGPETAPTDAQGVLPLSELVPRHHRRPRPGFQNPVMCDALGHVAEFATSNIWIVKDGVAITPCPTAPS